MFWNSASVIASVESTSKRRAVYPFAIGNFRIRGTALPANPRLMRAAQLQADQMAQALVTPGTAAANLVEARRAGGEEGGRWMTSEHVLDPELEDPRGTCLGRDLAEVAGVQIDGIGVAAAAKRRARIAPVEVIQQIERLHPELHVLRGAKRNPT